MCGNPFIKVLTEDHGLAFLLISISPVPDIDKLSFALQQIPYGSWRMKSESGKLPTAIAAIEYWEGSFRAASIPFEKRFRA